MSKFKATGTPKPRVWAICELGTCHTSYVKKTKWQKFCSAKCRYMAYDKLRPRQPISQFNYIKSEEE